MARQLPSEAQVRSVQKKDSFYERLVTGALDAIITIDEHSTVVLWNPAAEALFGYSAEEALGRNISELIIPPEYREAHAKGVRRMLETGVAPLMNNMVEIVGLHRDGSEIPVELSLFQPDESVRHYTAIIRDISIRKSMETEQRRVAAGIVEDIRNEIELDVVLQKIADGMGRLSQAERSLIWFCNPQTGAYEMPYEYRENENLPWIRDTSAPTEPVFSDSLSRDKLMIIEDTDAWPHATEQDRKLLKERNIRSLLHAPIVYHGEVLGLVRLHASSARIWSPSNLEIIKKLAGQAAVAIRHTSIIREQEKALARERLVRQVTELAGSSLSLETYLGRITELVCKHFRADRCQVIRYQPEESHGLSWVSYHEEDIPPLQESVLNPEAVYNASKSMPRGTKVCFSFDNPAQAPDYARRIAEKIDIRSAVCLQIDYYGRFFGYLTIHFCRQEKHWDADDLRFLEDLATHLGNAFFQTDLLEKEQLARKQAEEAGERYALVLEGSNDGLYDWNIVNDTVFWSDRMYEMLGLTREELPNPDYEAFISLVHPDDREYVITEVQKHLDAPESYLMEHRFRHKNGSYRYVTCRGKAVFDDQGRPVRLSGLVRDVTAQKKAEQALRESEARERLKREILETIDDTSDIKFILQNVADRLGVGLDVDRASVSRYRHTLAEDGREQFSFDVSAQYCRDETIPKAEPAMVSPEIMDLVVRNIPKLYAMKTIVASTREEYIRDMDARVADFGLDPDHHTRILDQLKVLMFERLGIRSHLRVPVEYRGVVYGTITVQHCRREHRWDPEEVRLAEEVAGYVGSALYQADLLKQEQEARRELEASNTLLSIISDTQSHFISRESIYTLFEKPLNGLLALTRSEYGFIGEILHDDDGKPYLKCNMLSDISWNDETQALYEEYRLKGMEFREIDNLFGEVIKTGEVVISNDPNHDPRSTGRPKGHPPLKSFLGMPFKKNGRLIGMVGIANRPGGYDEAVVEMLQPFLVSCANIIEGNRFEKVRNEMTAELKRNELSLRAYADRLEQSNKDLEDFAVIASHDLQEPLRKIRIFGDRLMSRATGELSEDSLVNVERIQAATHRMQDLISSLLVMSRINRKGKPFAPVDMVTVMNEVLQDNEISLQETGGKVEVSGACTVQADQTQMRQLFGNLVSNALKFRRPGVPPVIRVDLSEADGQCRIDISDNGIGFENKYLDRIFEPFRRLHGPGEYPGTGIGLAICKKIAERHGGTISATGKPDEGAVFTVILPVGGETG